MRKSKTKKQIFIRQYNHSPAEIIFTCLMLKDQMLNIVICRIDNKELTMILLALYVRGTVGPRISCQFHKVWYYTLCYYMSLNLEQYREHYAFHCDRNTLYIHGSRQELLTNAAGSSVIWIRPKPRRAKKNMAFSC